MLVDHSKRKGGGRLMRTRPGKDSVLTKNRFLKGKANQDPDVMHMDIVDPLNVAYEENDLAKSKQFKSDERARKVWDQDSWRFINKNFLFGPGANFSGFPFDYLGPYEFQDTSRIRKPCWMDQYFDPGDMVSDQEDDFDPDSPTHCKGLSESWRPQQVRLSEKSVPFQDQNLNMRAFSVVRTQIDDDANQALEVAPREQGPETSSARVFPTGKSL